MMRRGKRLIDFFFLMVGSALYAAAFRMFIEPQTLILGGATGLATLLHAWTGLPVFLGVLAVNLPLLAWGIVAHGPRILVRTALGVFLSSLFLALSYPLPVIMLPVGLSAVIGGALCGLGIGLLYLRGYTTGGSELAASLIFRYSKRISVGRWIFIWDTAIVLLSVAQARGLVHLLCSILLNLSFAIVFDALVGRGYGFSLGDG